MPTPEPDHINLVGVELEGLWLKSRTPKNPVHDGSVKFLDIKEPGCFVGETVSPPLTKEQVKGWIDENYPARVNDTCGLHIHISVRSDKDYIRLMSKDFECYFHDSMNKFGMRMGYNKEHPFWSRLRGSNPFCAKDFKPEEQVIRNDKRGPRYAQLNYCFGLHGTLECRLFHASENPVEIYKCVQEFINCVENFLEMPEVKFKNFEKTFEIYESDLLTAAAEADDWDELVVPSFRSGRLNSSYFATGAPVSYDLAATALPEEAPVPAEN